MDDLQKELEKRDRRRKYLVSQETYEQRLAEMKKLQELTWDLLRASPTGYAEFMRRNFKQRSIKVQRDDGQRL